MREELMPIAWHSRKWWNFYMSEDEEIKKQNQFLLSNAFNAHQQYISIETFCKKKLYTRLDMVQKPL